MITEAKHMNYDRYLTRVFDKQEKKMVYPGDSFFYNDKQFIYYNVNGQCEGGILCVYYSYKSLSEDGKSFTIPFGDRFVPMLCTGLRDKNKKLIYVRDILRVPPPSDSHKINFPSYEVFFHDNDSCDYHIGFQMNRVHYHGNVVGGSAPNFRPGITNRMEIIGNIHENPELLEDKV